MSCDGESVTGVYSSVMPSDWTDYGAGFGHDGKLYLAEWRGGFTIHQLRAMFFECQQVRTLTRDVFDLRCELEALSSKLDESERARAFYRSQVRLESSFGLMFAGVSAK